ncbi:MAG: DNA/RNA non-specific endonuclease [Alphaproteobacteria bacterium]|nr:DNA/RNA non-specific endonuclease [Alphaproteobacteria bacterium]
MGDVGGVGSKNYNSNFPADSSAFDDTKARDFQAVLRNAADSNKAQDTANDLVNQAHSGGSAPSNWMYQLTPQQQDLYDQAQKKGGPAENRKGQEQAGNAQPSKGWGEKLVDQLQDGVDVIKGEVGKGVTEGIKLADEYTPRSVKDSFNDIKGAASRVTEQLGKGINDGVAMVQENTPQAVRDVLNAGFDKAKYFQRGVDATKDWVGAKVEQAENAVSGQVNDTRKWLRENGGAAGQDASDKIGFIAGFGEAIYDFGKVTVKMVNEAGNLVNPLEWQVNPERNQQRLEGLKNGAEALGRIANLGNPIALALNPKENFQFANALGQGIGDAVSKAWHDDPAKAAGTVVGTVATFLIPVGAGAKAATGVKDAAEIATVADRVAGGGAKAAHLADDIARLGKGGTEIAKAVDGASAAGDIARLGNGAEIAGGVKRTDQAAMASRQATVAEHAKPPELPNASGEPKPGEPQQLANRSGNAAGKNGAAPAEGVNGAKGGGREPAGNAAAPSGPDATARATQATDASATTPPPNVARTVERFSSYADFEPVANAPGPNKVYEFGSYTYETDGLSRPCEISGQVRVKEFGRNPALQAKIGNEGKSTDVGFHLVADSLDGPPVRLNVVPGNGKRIANDALPNLNQGAYKRWENQVRNLASNPANKVEINVKPRYNLGNLTKRPDEFVMAHRVNGGKWMRQRLLNK